MYFRTDNNYLSVYRRRKNSLRLPGYDYRQSGYYFITTCTHNREELFGKVVDGRIVLNIQGKIVEKTWLDLPRHYHCTLDKFIVMPNHVHGIIIIPTPVGAGLRPAPTGVGLSEIVRAMKAFSARRINESLRTPGVAIWQRGFYDHIIRNGQGLHAIRDYIRTNPEHWLRDRNVSGVFM